MNTDIIDRLKEFSGLDVALCDAIAEIARLRAHGTTHAVSVKRAKVADMQDLVVLRGYHPEYRKGIRDTLHHLGLLPAAKKPAKKVSHR